MDLVQQFAEETACLGLDLSWRTWGGMLLTSCLLGRGVWTSITNNLPCYPNLYVLFVAPSGHGKTLLFDCVRAGLAPYTGDAQVGVKPRIVLTPNKCSVEYLYQVMGKAFPDNGPRATCVGVMNDEIGDFFGNEVTLNQSSSLCSIWDAKEMKYDKGTITGLHKGTNTNAWAPYVSAGWGTTPAWLSAAMPKGVFMTGLPARMVYTFSDTPLPERANRGSGEAETFGDRLMHRLNDSTERVIQAKGFFPFTDAALDALNDWLDAGKPSWDGKPFNLDFEQYALRRFQEMGKLSLVVSCARHPWENTITLEDFEAARDAYLVTERRIPEVLACIGENPDVAIENEVVAWVRSRGEVYEPDLRDMMRHKVQRTRDVRTQLEELVASGQLIDTLKDGPPRRRFRAAA